MSEPRWLDEPTQPTNLPHLPLVRVKPGAGLFGALTSSKLIGVPTHYMSRRTLPCVTDGCPGCEAKLACRPEWYAGFKIRNPGNHVIVALTPACAWQIKDRFHNLTTLRGVGLTLTRAGKAGNSRLLVECHELELAQLKLPDEPDLIKHLLHIWGLDQGQLGQDNAGYVNRVKDHFRGNGQATDAAKTG